MKKIITISREFGSGGRTIAKELAERLGYKYYDKELVKQVAAETGFDPSYIEETGEHAASANPLIPYPGTRAYQWARENGYITGNYQEYLREDGTLNCIIQTPELSADELVAFCSYARKKYYLRPWYIAHRLWRGLCDFEDLKRSLKAFSKLKKTLFR